MYAHKSSLKKAMSLGVTTLHSGVMFAKSHRLSIKIPKNQLIVIFLCICDIYKDCTNLDVFGDKGHANLCTISSFPYVFQNNTLYISAPLKSVWKCSLLVFRNY